MIELPLVQEKKEWMTPEFWRSMDELSPEYRAEIEREFPEQAGLLDDPVSRRQFLTLMGASLALVGISGCGRQLPDKIVPRVRQPEGTIPGKASYFATAMPHPGGAVGLLVESHEGRPTKIEGNPLHPASLGAAGVFEQASILDLYDPDRAKVIKYNGQVIGWDDALLEIEKELSDVITKNGEGFALLTGHINSPTLAAQIRELLKELPGAKWYTHDPGVSNASYEASKRVFGQPFDFVYDIERADVILSLDCDFLASGPNHMRYARQFAKRRKPERPMNRLYAIEAMPTPTGFAADHRLALPPTRIEELLQSVMNGQPSVDFVQDAHNDVTANPGKSLVIAGPYLAQGAHELALAINVKARNVGATIHAINPVDAQSDLGLKDFCQAMDRREVNTLVILSANPAYTSSPTLQFAERLFSVRTRICLSSHEDETASLCNWQLPEAHYLESWSDARAADGTASIIQPLIAPLYAGRTAHQLIAALVNIVAHRGQSTTTGREIVRDYWRRWHGENGVAEPFEKFWRSAVHDGIFLGTAATPQAAKVVDGWSPPPATKREDSIELILRPDPTVFDGRFANNAWLQELPKPLTKLCWENAAIISPAMAKELGIEMREGPHGGSHGELITECIQFNYEYAERPIPTGSQSATIMVHQMSLFQPVPVYVLPGHPDHSVTLHFGYGRQKAGRVGNGIGINAYFIQSPEAMWGGPGPTIKRTGIPYTLACTQSQHSMESRDLARMVTAAEFAKDPTCAPKHQHAGHHGHNPPVEGFPAEELYTNPQTKGPYQWGMAVDLGACNGCNACVMACQAENNIPVVGKEQVIRGREMHWLRIDRYFVGDLAKPKAAFMPVMCQHCENAPCEVVCPVEATTHSPDGLNEMTYNRCVGTRYCSNNCPYKVRRFNFLEYTDYATESLKLQRNPDVSVRVRGVMEKCTYCVQRIRAAEITVKIQHRSIADGDIVTACQAACPSEAIVFGNVADPKSRVSKLKDLPRNYGILTELNTKPRTTYLAAVKNMTG
jgi:molybdopterin-containing oxidoreductase family iron-sulfur binding subunit